MNLFEKLVFKLGFKSGAAPTGGAGPVITDPEELLRRMEHDLLLRSEFYRWIQTGKGRHFLSSLFEQAQLEKNKMIELVNAYKDTFFHSMIVGLLVDDVLSADPVTNNVVDIITMNDYLRPILDDLQERLDIDNLVESIIDDIISYGDYVVRVIIEDGKVVALEDDVDQSKVVVVYRQGVPIFLINIDELYKGPDNLDKTLKIYSEFIHFCIGRRKIKIKVDNDLMKTAGIPILSEYVRVGRPLFWSTWDLLNSLYVLTVFYPVFSVQKLNASTVVGVRVPPEVSQARGWEVAKKYQELLNVFTAVDQYGRVSLADVIDTVGRYKVIPVWGDEKGLLQLADPRLEESFALDILVELRKVLCATLGIPYGFLFGSEENLSKLDSLKSFSRYVKRIGSIQRAIRDGLTQLAMIECNLRGLRPSPEDIEVRFRNSIINVEHLDKLEFVAGLVETVNSTTDVITSIAERLSTSLDKEKLIDFLNSYLSMVGLEGCIKPPESGGEQVQPPPVPEDEFMGVGIGGEEEEGEEEFGLFEEE